MPRPMTTYLVVTGDNPNYVTRVDAGSLCDAIEDLGLEYGESVVIYRVPDPVMTVSEAMALYGDQWPARWAEIQRRAKELADVR